MHHCRNHSNFRTTDYYHFQREKQKQEVALKTAKKWDNIFRAFLATNCTLFGFHKNNPVVISIQKLVPKMGSEKISEQQLADFPAVRGYPKNGDQSWFAFNFEAVFVSPPNFCLWWHDLFEDILPRKNTLAAPTAVLVPRLWWPHASLNRC